VRCDLRLADNQALAAAMAHGASVVPIFVLDPAANNGGWQWTAGTATDAASYFRVFNAVAQGMKFDPDGEYVRRWVPELARVPGRYIHAPWDMPAEVQRAAGCVIGGDYPEPLVDHQVARVRALAAHAAARSNG
jgi:deoxyribodipyrimidine photo-lyase